VQLLANCHGHELAAVEDSEPSHNLADIGLSHVVAFKWADVVEQIQQADTREEVRAMQAGHSPLAKRALSGWQCDGLRERLPAAQLQRLAPHLHPLVTVAADVQSAGRTSILHCLAVDKFGAARAPHDRGRRGERRELTTLLTLPFHGLIVNVAESKSQK